MISNTLCSDENYHELMDVVGSLINPEIHENCMHSSGDIIIWLGTYMRSPPEKPHPAAGLVTFLGDFSSLS